MKVVGYNEVLNTLATSHIQDGKGVTGNPAHLILFLLVFFVYFINILTLLLLSCLTLISQFYSSITDIIELNVKSKVYS